MVDFLSIDARIYKVLNTSTLKIDIHKEVK